MWNTAPVPAGFTLADEFTHSLFTKAPLPIHIVFTGFSWRDWNMFRTVLVTHTADQASLISVSGIICLSLKHAEEMILLHLILEKQTPKASAGDIVQLECPDLQIVTEMLRNTQQMQGIFIL